MYVAKKVSQAIHSLSYLPVMDVKRSLDKIEANSKDRLGHIMAVIGTAKGSRINRATLLTAIEQIQKPFNLYELCRCGR